MNKAIAGRAIAAVGIGLGLAAIWTDVITVSGRSVLKYADDGTVMAYLLITLIVAALLLLAGFAGRRGLDSAAATVGAAALGFLLYIPTGFALYHLGYIGTGGWLGICAVLVPIGAWMAHVAERSSAPARKQPPPQMALPVTLGLVLCLAGIWLPAEHDSDTGNTKFWDFGYSGHPIGILMLILIVLVALLVLATVVGAMPAAADAGLVVAGVTFGFAEALVIGNAFNQLGSLRVGAWLIAAGGVILLAGAWWLREAAQAEAQKAKPKPAAAKKTRK
ncbi:MAG: hypothetical protein ABSB96_08480 [Gaiellaceae bacterium]